MTQIDLAIIFLYIAALFVVGIVVGIKESVEDFLILSRAAKFPLVLFSIVSTWVGVGVFVGTAAAAHETGIGFGLTGAVGALTAAFAVNWGAPTIKRFGDKYGAHTLGDFYLIRYSRKAQVLAASIIVFVYLIFTAVQFVGLASLLRVWTSFDMETGIVIAAATTIIYTAFAGIKSDFYTDAVHFWVVTLVLFGVLLPVTWTSTGGTQLLEQIPPRFFSPFGFGGIVFFLGGLIFGAGTGFVSMELWQRIYASETKRGAQSAILLSVVFIVAFYALATYFGLVSSVTNPQLADRNLAFYSVMKRFLSPGYLGLGIAAFLAIFMSSVNTMIMVVSATFIKDFYKGMINPTSSERNLLSVGRVLTVIAGLLGVAVAYFVHDIVNLSVTALFMLLVLLPSVVGGFFWRRGTASAAVWSMFVGLVVSLALIKWMPQTAFVPGFVSSLIVYVAVSWRGIHAASEVIDL